jgi:hypothetical protein
LNRGCGVICLATDGQPLPSPYLPFGGDGFLELNDSSVLMTGIGGVYRLLPEGGIDTNFQCRATGGVVRDVAQLSNGDVVIGGNFTAINGVPRKGLARIFLSEHTPEPVLLGPFFSEGGFRLYFPTIRARTYALESSGDLNSTTCVPVTSIPGNGNWNTIQDPVMTAGKRFYRVRVEK